MNLLRSSVLPVWVHDEIKVIENLRFRFAEKRSAEKYAVQISESMKNPVPRSLLLSGPRLIWEWDEKLVRGILETLTVENGRVVVMAKDHNVIGNEGPWEKEPWYQTEYTVKKLEDEFLTSVGTVRYLNSNY